MIADGKLQGYIVARFAYTLDFSEGTERRFAVTPEPFLLDEAFRDIYSEPDARLSCISTKVDLTKLTKDLVKNVNTRLAGERVADYVLVEEFNYVSKEDMSK